MDPSDHLAALRTGADHLLAAAAGALDRPVPTCPEWDVGELVRHVARTWGWADDVVTTRQRAELGPAPDGGSDASLLGWARGRAEHLCTTLGAADPDGDCWTFGLPRSVRFWIRRMALETALHAYDAERATGVPRPIDPEVAADGVDEYVSVLVSRWVSRHPEGWDGQSVHLQRTDGADGWLVRLGPDGTTEVEGGQVTGDGDVALRGPAEALWLWACGRAPLGAPEVGVLGDPAVAARWTAQISF